MKRFFVKLAQLSFGTCVLATAAVAQTPVSPPSVWPFNITAPGSYRLTANMLSPAASSAIVISANNVTLDLNGFTVSQNGLVVLCGPDTTTGYGSTCSAGAGPALIVGNGRNITIKNGNVYNGPGGGIQISGPTAALNAAFEDLRVMSNRGAGIVANGEGNRFFRVDASYNAGDGINAVTSVLSEVSVSWNDGVGLSAGGPNIASGVMSRANGADGVFFNGVIERALTERNHGNGFIAGGVLKSIYSSEAANDLGGVIMDSQFGAAYIASGCYSQIRTGALTGSGVPMTSNTCP